MTEWNKPRWQIRSQVWAIVTLLLLGIFFRVVELGERVYWVDEVATSMRVAGYTREQVIEELADTRILSVADLQHYQKLSPSLGWSDTLAALQHSPEHAPLYFLLARLWSQCFGSSVVAMRSLSVLLSLLALPCLFLLSWQLFGSGTASIATGLLAVSPFFVAYAQEARPYSLWTVVLLLNGWLLLRAMGSNDRLSWWGYGVSVAVALYTSLLSGLLLLGQGVYVAVLEGWRPTQRMRRFLLAAGGAVLCFLPWLGVMALHWADLHDNTSWSRGGLGVLPMLAIWLYNIAVVYFDVPVVASPIWVGLLEVSIALIVTSVIGFSIYWLWAKTSSRCWLFVLSLIAAIPVCLIGLDLVQGNQLSTAARYMLPSLLGVQLAMGYLLANKLNRVAKSDRIQPWRWIFALIITLSLISCLFQLYQPPKYQKSRSLHNQPIAAILNQVNAPLLWTESAQIIDVISLSYSLQPDTKIQLLSNTAALPGLRQCQNVFVFNPSPFLEARLRSQPDWRLQSVYQPQRLIPDEIVLSLWSIVPANQDCAQPDE